MTYVILNTCEKDDVCATACPEEAIGHGTVTFDGVDYDQYYIDPAKCQDCGTCETVCPSGSIFVDLDLTPKEKIFLQVNAAFFAQ